MNSSLAETSTQSSNMRVVTRKSTVFTALIGTVFHDQKAKEEVRTS